MAFCSKCGSQYHDNERFCTQCGAATGAGSPASVTPSAPPPGRRSSSSFMTCLILFLSIGAFTLILGGALLWWWAPWKDRPSGSGSTASGTGSGAKKKRRWDEGLDTEDTSARSAQQQEWAAAAEAKAGEVEQAFRRKDVSAVLKLVAPTSRAEYEPGLQAAGERMVRFADVLATRKLKVAYRDAADFEVRDGQRTFPVTFVRVDGKWYLDQF